MYNDRHLCCCSVAKLCLTLHNSVDSMQQPGSSVLQYIQEFAHSCPLSQWCYLTISSSAAFFSSRLQPFPPSGSCLMSQLFTSGDQVLELQYQSFQWIFRVDFLSDWLLWSPCFPRDSQESSPAPQFKSISSSVLCLLYGPTVISARDSWKNHSFNYTDLCW